MTSLGFEMILSNIEFVIRNFSDDKYYFENICYPRSYHINHKPLQSEQSVTQYTTSRQSIHVINVITDTSYSLLIASFLDILKAFKVRHQQQLWLGVGGNKQVDDVSEQEKVLKNKAVHRNELKNL